MERLLPITTQWTRWSSRAVVGQKLDLRATGLFEETCKHKAKVVQKEQNRISGPKGTKQVNSHNYEIILQESNLGKCPHILTIHAK